MDRMNRFSSGEKKQPKSKENNHGKHHKYKKRSGQNSDSSNFIHEYIEQIEERPNEQTRNYWHSQGQKLCSAISDPAVCGYSVPFGYPFDQVAFPVYPLIPAAPVQRTFNNLMSYPETKPRQKKQEDYEKLVQKQAQYTSLPPGSAPEFGPDQRRRFSDPGLANAQISEDSCSTSSTTDNEQIMLEDIHKENNRLTKELNSTREELRTLKLDVCTLLETQNMYPAGVITDMVKEVESAIELREQVIFSKTQQMVKDLVQKLGGKSAEKEGEKGPTKQEFEEIKKKLNDVVVENEKLNKRISKLEEFIQNDIGRRLSKVEELLGHSNTEHSTQEIKHIPGPFVLDKKIRKQLQDAFEVHKQSDKGPCLRIKPFVKLPNSASVDDKEKCESINVSSSLETSESLTSSIGSGSLHSPLVTMSGPVTDV